LTAVGFFGSYLFDGSTWHSFDPHDIDPDDPHDFDPTSAPPDIAGRWLRVYIYDSDFAIVGYQPTGPGSGVAYLGWTPRAYFQDESAAPTDVHREAEGLAFWLSQQQGGSGKPELRELVASFLADDARAPLADDADFADLDDADIFVEVKVAKFLKAVGLPVPGELQEE
jgi:hypothetical protein